MAAINEQFLVAERSGLSRRTTKHIKFVREELDGYLRCQVLAVRTEDSLCAAFARFSLHANTYPRA